MATEDDDLRSAKKDIGIEDGDTDSDEQDILDGVQADLDNPMLNDDDTDDAPETADDQDLPELEETSVTDSEDAARNRDADLDRDGSGSGTTENADDKNDSEGADNEVTEPVVPISPGRPRRGFIVTDDDVDEEKDYKPQRLLIDDEVQDVPEEKPRHRVRHLFIVVGSILLVVLLGFAAFCLRNITSPAMSTVTVPAAKAYLAQNDITDPCSTFKKSFLKCAVKWDTNDNVRNGGKISQIPTAGKTVEKNSNVVLHYSKGPAESQFPNLIGVSLEDARTTLYNIGVSIKDIKMVNSDGRQENSVMASSINAGDEVKNGDEVSLQISNGRVTVPDWTGKTREFVEADAKNIGIEVNFKEVSHNGASGIVLSQTPKAGNMSNTIPVEVTISKAAERKTITVPNVIGKNQNDAQVALAAAGFLHIKIVQVKNSQVTSAQVTQVVPGVGQTAGNEDPVTIIVSQPDKK